VVFFTLLLVTGNTMAIAVRERTRELAVLKAVGFSDGFVLVLVIVETIVVAAVGGGHRARAWPSSTRCAAIPPAACCRSFYLPANAIRERPGPGADRRAPGRNPSRRSTASRLRIDRCAQADLTWRCAADLQRAQPPGALGLHGGGGARHRRHRWRVRGHAVTGARVRGDADRVGLAAERDSSGGPDATSEMDSSVVLDQIKVIEDAPGIDARLAPARW